MLTDPFPACRHYMNRMLLGHMMPVLILSIYRVLLITKPQYHDAKHCTGSTRICVKISLGDQEPGMGRWFNLNEIFVFSVLNFVPG
jgi:hypothetical protein